VKGRLSWRRRKRVAIAHRAARYQSGLCVFPIDPVLAAWFEHLVSFGPAKFEG